MTIIDKLFFTVDRQKCLLPVTALLTLFVMNVSAQESDSLFQQIQTLQSQMAIQIIGMERIQNEDKVMTSGNPEQQIQQLFASFNHVVSRNAKGQIERIVIINKKQKQDEQGIVLPTNAQGSHRTVPVAISGDGSLWQNLDMVIDTGADLVVLPDSLIAQIGLDDSNFSHEKIQTANGTVDAKIGKLKELKIAGETVEDVATAFIPDALLGKNSLLGMSVLSHFRITIDDKMQTVTLFKK
ncbi:MAG: clan AA aspartic protease [Methylococcaceae bacterium]|nr:clan AA aspartic protease [Methylococcaceae bacterium]